MDFTLYTEVILVQDMSEEGVRAGDVGVVVERHEITGRETGYSVEFFDMLGNTVAAPAIDILITKVSDSVHFTHGGPPFVADIVSTRLRRTGNQLAAA